MATTIRLTRMGRKKRPFYRLVVLDSRKRRDGAYLANLGYYNPFCNPYEVDLHESEILSWLDKGATVSETARALLRAEGVLYKYTLVKQGLDTAEIDTRMSQWRQSADTKRQAKLEAVEAKKAAEAAAEAKAKAEAEAAAKAEAEAAAKAEAEAAAKAEAEAAAAEAAAAEPAEATAEEPAPEAGDAEGEDT